MTPMMYKIEIEGKPYLDPVKKFAVSNDCVLAALVKHDNQILIYRVSPFSSLICVASRDWYPQPGGVHQRA